MWARYATFAALAGVTNLYDHRAATAGLPQPDGLDMWPMVSGANVTSPRVEVVLSALSTAPDATRYAQLAPDGFKDPMYFTSGEAIVVADYKLIVGAVMKGPFGSAGPDTCDQLAGPWNKTNPGVPCSCPKPGCLFNVVTDPNERDDLAKKMPDVVLELTARLDAARKTVYAPYRGDLDPAACAIVKGQYHGYWGPWLPMP